MSTDHSPVVTRGVTSVLLLTNHKQSSPRTLPVNYPTITNVQYRVGYQVTKRYPVSRCPHVGNAPVVIGNKHAACYRDVTQNQTFFCAPSMRSNGLIHTHMNATRPLHDRYRGVTSTWLCTRHNQSLPHMLPTRYPYTTKIRMHYQGDWPSRGVPLY